MELIAEKDLDIAPVVTRNGGGSDAGACSDAASCAVDVVGDVVVDMSGEHSGVQAGAQTGVQVDPVGGMRTRRAFPTWHFSMMNDHRRNEAMHASIKELDLAGKTVLEIGTGAGLVALYFADGGADHVYTCEMDPQLYDVAVKTVKENGFEDRITVIPESSTEFIKSARFNFSPDIIFTETLDCGVIGEGFYSVAKDISQIARPDTAVLPGDITQYGFLVCSQDIASNNVIQDESGFNISEINRFSTKSYFPIRYFMHKSVSLSRVHEIRRYSYLQPPEKTKLFTMQAYASGLCHGIVSFFHAQFGQAVVSNDIRDTGHWHQAFHPFLEPVHVDAGTTYTLVMRADGSISFLN